MSGGGFSGRVTSGQKMLCPSDLMVFKSKYHQDFHMPSCTLRQQQPFQNLVLGLVVVQGDRGAGCRTGFAARQGNENMQRVVSRHRALKLNQFRRFQLTNAAVLQRCSRISEPNHMYGIEAMDLSAHKALVGSTWVPSSFVWRRGASTIRKCSMVPSSRPATPRRSFREKQTLISHKIRQQNSRIQSGSDFTPQRLLECAVDVLRNFNEKVENLRRQWGRGTGSHDFSTAAEKQPPLDADSSVRDDAAVELENANEDSSGKLDGREFEWGTALWEAEVLSAEELESASHRIDPVRLETGREISQLPRTGHDDAEIMPRAEETVGGSGIAANVELELPQNGTAVKEVEARDGASLSEAEEVDIGDLWNRRSQGYISQTDREPVVGNEARPGTSGEIADPTINDLERSKEQSAVEELVPRPEELPMTDTHPRTEILSAEVDSVASAEPQVEELDVQSVQEKEGDGLQASSIEASTSNLHVNFPEPSPRRPERDGGRFVEQEEQLSEASPFIERDMSSFVPNANVEVEVETSSPELTRDDAGFSGRDQAGQSFVSKSKSNSEPMASTGENGLSKSFQTSASESLDREEAQTSIEEEAVSSLEPSKPSFAERESGDFRLSEQPEITETSLHEQGRIATQSPSPEQAESLTGEQVGHSSSFSSSINLEESSISKQERDAGLELSSTLGLQPRTSSSDFGDVVPAYAPELETDPIEPLSQEQEYGDRLIQDSGKVTERSAGMAGEELLEDGIEGRPRLGGEDRIESDEAIGSGDIVSIGGQRLVREASLDEDLDDSDQEPSSDDFDRTLRGAERDDALTPSNGHVITDLSANTYSLDQRSVREVDNRDLQQEIERLRRSVSHHAYLYHTLDNPVISDSAYDALVQELNSLEVQASNSTPTRNVEVGAQPSPDMLKVLHAVPMLSLASIQKEEELLSWHDRLQQKLGSASGAVGWVVEPKIDGLALSIRYEHGLLKCAATRGDGFQGEDVTHNTRTVVGIPQTIPHELPGTSSLLTSLEVRGEVFMSLKQFEELNAAKIRAGSKPMANPRNAAAGSMRLLSSSSINDLRPLTFMAYSIANIEVSAAQAEEDSENSLKKPSCQWAALQLLESIGFSVNKDNRFFESFDSALQFAKDWRKTRSAMDYETDGVVFKVNDLATQASLGSTGADPRWAVAWKFLATEAVSVLEGIELTVGRSGVIIPNARFQPVELGGAVVSRASLHNIGHVKSLGLCEGDHIVVQRAGDVIPQVSQVLEDLRPGTANPWVPPQECPSCGSKLTETSGGSMVFCPNPLCGSRNARQVAHFAKTLIPGLGSGTLNQLEDELLVKDPADFYNLDKEALSNVKGFGKLSITKLLKAIDESKQQDLSLFIVALGIPRVGMNTARELAHTFGTLQGLLKADINSLKTVPGIGAATAAGIFEWCQGESNIELIRRLELAGCRVNDYNAKPESLEDGTLNGSPSGGTGTAAVPAGIESGEDLVKVPEASAEGEADSAENRDNASTTTEIGGNAGDENASQQPAIPALSGKVVVITGDFGPLLRKDMKELVTGLGGTLRTSVTSRTSLLLCGKRPGPVKVSEAGRYGVETMDWESFSKLIGRSEDAA